MTTSDKQNAVQCLEKGMKLDLVLPKKLKILKISGPKRDLIDDESNAYVDTVFTKIENLISWASAGGQNGHFPPWKLGLCNKNVLKT